MVTERPAMLISTHSSGPSDGLDCPDTPPPHDNSSFHAQDRRLSTLPSPPLSPQDTTRHHNHFLPLALDPSQLQDNDDNNTVDMSEPIHLLQGKQQQQQQHMHMHMHNDHEANTVTVPVNTTPISEILSSHPALPSQLRKYHESMKFLDSNAQQQQQPQPAQQSQLQENQVQEQQPPQTDIGDSSHRRQPLNDYDASVSPFSLPPLPSVSQSTDHEAQDKTKDMEMHLPVSTIKKTRFEDITSSPTLPTLPCENSEEEDHDGNSQRTESPTEMSSPSYHSSGALIRAKSFSMFESTSDSILGSGGRHYQPYSNRNSFMNPNYNTSMDFPEIVMPTRDWIKMQTRINSLETEIAHVTRTNLLLNQELDKVSGHLQRLTSESGVGWQKEYEFLVQQVDLMHRQLQITHSQSPQGGGGGGHQGQPVRGQPEMTRQLHAEVKDLTASLKSWQTAFKQADDKYRRKCDGERELKQMLRERESQLSSLVEKLSGYESEFKRSMSNYEQLVRLTSELEALDGKRKLSEGDRSMVTTASMSTSTSTLAQSIISSPPETATTANVDPVYKQSRMPGLFPDLHTQRQPAPSTDHLTVSILSWAALLATYILS